MSKNSAYYRFFIQEYESDSYTENALNEMYKVHLNHGLTECYRINMRNPVSGGFDKTRSLFVYGYNSAQDMVRAVSFESNNDPTIVGTLAHNNLIYPNKIDSGTVQRMIFIASDPVAHKAEIEAATWSPMPAGFIWSDIFGLPPTDTWWGFVELFGWTGEDFTSFLTFGELSAAIGNSYQLETTIRINAQTAGYKQTIIPNNGKPISVFKLGLPDGKPMIFLHGFPETWFSWRHQMKHFADKGYYCISVESRGVGESWSPTDSNEYTINKLAEDVNVVIDTLTDGSAVLVGHDWGAQTAYRTYLNYPGKVTKLVMMSVPPVKGDSGIQGIQDMADAGSFNYQYPMIYNPLEESANVDKDLTRWVTEMSILLQVRGGMNDFTQWFTIPFGTDRTTTPPQVDSFFEMFEHLRAAIGDNATKPLPYLDPIDYEVQVSRLLISGSLGHMLKYKAQDVDLSDSLLINDWSVNVPLLFIGGENDVMRLQILAMTNGAVDIFTSADLYAGIPNKTIEVITGAGHMIQQEKPTRVNTLMNTFLGN